MAIKGKSFLTAALLVVAGGGLSGCVYDVGLGYASDGHYDDEYGCDPSGGYDAYYECDYGHAFSDIGFAGGWFGNYYYPGHGVFLFDNAGRRYPMREQYRRYWGERRHNWYREHRGRDWGGGGHQERRRGYNDNRLPRAHDWRDRQDSRTRDGNDGRRDGWREDRRDDRRDGARGAGDQWPGGGGRGAVVTPAPNIDVPPDRGRGQDYGNAYGRPDRRDGGGPNADAVPAPQRRGSPIQKKAAPVEQLPEPSREPQDPPARRQRVPEGGVERPD